MLKTHHQFFRILFQVMDGLIVAISFWLAYAVRFYWHPNFLPGSREFVPFSNYIGLLLPLIFIWFLALQISGAYKSWRNSLLPRELFAISKACVLAFLIVISTIHFFAREDFSRVFLILFLAIVLVNLSLERILLRSLLRALRRRGFNQRHLLFVGDSLQAELINRKVRGRPELGVKIIGIVPVGSASSKGELTTLPVLGGPHDLEQILAKEGIDQVIICLRNEDAAKLDQLLTPIMNSNVHVRIVPDIFQYAILGFEVEEFDGIPIVSLNQSPLVGWNAVLKRISDILIATGALLIFSPVMLILALLVRLTSRGPIFFSQERMGLDGRTFRMYKLRSMRIDAETKTGAVWAKKDDNRTTWIGALMRKTSLDELPQLFNVLLGHMSCVGPRPERPVFVDQFRHRIPGYMLRHRVKAGMTGWAQINGLRGNTSLEARIEHDLYYITHWSLAFDLRIMIMTIFKGFISPHAY